MTHLPAPILPRWAHDAPIHAADGFHPEFADFARWMLDSRRRGWPALIEAGQMTREQASHRYWAMEAIEAIWRATVEGGDPAWLYHWSDVTKGMVITELSLTIEGAAAIRESAPNDRLARDRHEALLAMRWHLSRYPESAAYPLHCALTLRADITQLQLDIAELADAASRKAAA